MTTILRRKLMQVTVKGSAHQWGFLFSGDPKYLEEWRADGLDVAVVSNVIPVWVPSWAIRAWVAAQDVINFKWGK